MKISLRRISVSLRILMTLMLVLLTSVFALAIEPVPTPTPLPSVDFKKPSTIECTAPRGSIKERILYEYGAVYISDGALLPPTCLMSKAQTNVFTDGLTKPKNKLDYGNYYLQPKAKAALKIVIDKFGDFKKIARSCNGTDCDNDVNNDWALRTFKQAKDNWDSHKPAGKTDKQIVHDQTRPKPFIFSYAVPGASQHHLGLAVDVVDGGLGSTPCDDGTPCHIEMEKNGWYRTIRGDRYHFTFLGFPSEILPSKGLKHVKCKDPATGKDFKYWVPRVAKSEYTHYSGWGCTNVP